MSEIPALTYRDIINLNTDYFARHRNERDDLFGLFTHELCHVAQHYPDSAETWLKEGIADFVRYYVVRPEDPARRFNPDIEDWSMGYQPAAGFLFFLTGRFSNIIQQLDARLRSGQSGERYIQEVTGEPIAVTWTRYVTSL